jgi:glycerophosphoryl diester phosphodiesterase
MTVNVWTVNDADEMRRLAAAGVDAVITDVPDVARRVLTA